jgi:hypothetical protein
MRVCKVGLSAVALVLAGLTAPASAATPQDSHAGTMPPPAIEPAGNAAQPKSPPDFAAIASFVDKLFPPQPAPDPARLAIARTSVQAMWPDGAYSKMMVGLMGGMFDRLMELKSSDLAGFGDKAHKTGANAPADVSVHDKAAAKDPLFDKRMSAVKQVMTEEMGKISAIIDPRMRDGLARAMARRFDAQQLGEINHFFATPTGQLFAGQYMQLWVDPDTLRSVFASIPELVKLMPEASEKLKAANDKFPKPPAFAKPKKP